MMFIMFLQHSSTFYSYITSSANSATDPFTPRAAEQLRLAGRAVAEAVALGAEGAGAVGVEEAPSSFVQGPVHVAGDLGVVLGRVLPRDGENMTIAAIAMA